MSDTFNKAYNEATRMLNGSGVSSIVSMQHRDDMKFQDRVKDFSPTANKNKGGKVMAGGLSNLKKSININGQPHSLAWINPDEASALKAMGGSGKPGPMGIPSYQEADPDAYVDASADIQDTVGPDEGGYSWNWGPTGGYDYSTDEKADPGRDVSVLGETGYSDEELRDYAAGLGTTVRGLGPIGTERATAEHHDQLTDMRKGILGLYGDRMTRGEVLDKAKSLGYTTWRNTVGRYADDPWEEYQAWFAAQDPNALIAGYRSGDPVGKAMQQQNEMIQNIMQNKVMKDAEGKITDLYRHRGREGKATEEEQIESFSTSIQDNLPPGYTFDKARGNIYDIISKEGIKGLTASDVIPAAIGAAAGPIGKAMGLYNILAEVTDSKIVGTITDPHGRVMNVDQQGRISYPSPEDDPTFDHDSMRGENVEAPIRRRIPQQKVSVSESITEEEPLTGMKGLLARRSKPSTRVQSNTFLSNLLDDIYGSDREEMLG